MASKYNWNNEIITQFYSTLYFHKGDEKLIWMIDEMRCGVYVADFASYIGLRSHIRRQKKIHDEHTLSKNEMMFMYAPSTALKSPSITGFSPKLITLHKILTKSLDPRDDDAIVCPTYERN
jgi:hypothetical protein